MGKNNFKILNTSENSKFINDTILYKFIIYVSDFFNYVI